MSQILLAKLKHWWKVNKQTWSKTLRRLKRCKTGSCEEIRELIHKLLEKFSVMGNITVLVVEVRILDTFSLVNWALKCDSFE